MTIVIQLALYCFPLWLIVKVAVGITPSMGCTSTRRHFRSARFRGG